MHTGSSIKLNHRAAGLSISICQYEQPTTEPQHVAPASVLSPSSLLYHLVSSRLQYMASVTTSNLSTGHNHEYHSSQSEPKSEGEKTQHESLQHLPNTTSNSVTPTFHQNRQDCVDHVLLSTSPTSLFHLETFTILCSLNFSQEKEKNC